VNERDQGGGRPLAILCGGGAFPLEVAAEARREGRAPFLIGVVGWSEPEIEVYPHIWVRVGEVGKLFGALKERSIAELAMIGRVARPEFSDLRLDWGAVKRAVELSQLFRKGDDGLLVGLARIFEREGVRIVGAHEVAPQLLAPSGALGARLPSSEDEADIVSGASLIEAMSRFDVGQAAVVAAGRVLAVEAAEGTDAMLARVAGLRENGRLRRRGSAGVLVKAPKRGQDLRLDMPAVGPDTISAAANAGLRGIAFAAGRVLIAGRERFAREADAAGLFAYGFKP
jgi:DUF1009 family protein